MALPPPNDDGWLPPGVYDVTLEELRQGFGVFKTSERRPNLYSKLAEYVGELRKRDIATEVIVDGSFVSAKPTPGDIDVVVCLREEFLNRQEEWIPVERNLVDKAFARKKYEIDLWPAPAGSGFARATEFFEQKKPPESGTKGILRLKL